MAESSKHGHKRASSTPASSKSGISPFRHGKFTVTVVEAKDLVAPEAGNSKMYCTCQFEKQELRTDLADYTQTPKWNHEFIFDTTQTLVEVYFAIWEFKKDETRRFVGRLIIRVNLLMIETSGPLINFYGLRGRFEGEQVTGEIRLKLHFTASKNSISIEDFEPICVLGRGGFGKVMLVRKRDTERLYAIKSLHKSKLIESDEVEGTKTEKEVLKKINHPFIVGLKYSFQTEDKLYMVLDYINGGELFYHLKKERRFTENRARFYAAELTLALEYLHRINVIYRDLKPENILLDSNGHICLTDFGLCKEGLGYGKMTYTFCGTAEYLAPEVLKGKGYDKAVDWWSLGTLIYEMLVGRPPFFSTNTNEMYQKILRDQLSFPTYVTPLACSLLSSLLERVPADRLGSSFSDAEEVKSHPFFGSIDWNQALHKEVEPPFKPPVKDSLDTGNFDPNFTNQAVSESPVDWHLAPNQQVQFANFSYVSPSEITESPANEKGFGDS